MLGKMVDSIEAWYGIELVVGSWMMFHEYLGRRMESEE